MILRPQKWIWHQLWMASVWMSSGFYSCCCPYAWWLKGLLHWNCPKCQRQKNEGEWGTVNFFKSMLQLIYFTFACKSPSFFTESTSVLNPTLILHFIWSKNLFLTTVLMAFMFYIHNCEQQHSPIHPHFSSFYYLNVSVFTVFMGKLKIGWMFLKRK